MKAIVLKNGKAKPINKNKLDSIDIDTMEAQGFLPEQIRKYLEEELEFETKYPELEVTGSHTEGETIEVSEPVWYVREPKGYRDIIIEPERIDECFVWDGTNEDLQRLKKLFKHLEFYQCYEPIVEEVETEPIETTQSVSELAAKIYKEKYSVPSTDQGEGFQYGYSNGFYDGWTNREELFRNFLRTNHLTNQWETYLKDKP